MRTLARQLWSWFLSICICIFGASTPFKAESLSKNYVVVGPERLSDQDFRNAVLCGVQPGGLCIESPKLWTSMTARDLRVVIHNKNLDPAASALFEADIDAAISEINSVSSVLHLRKVSQANGCVSCIEVYLSNYINGDVIGGTETALDGVVLEGAAVTIAWDDNNHLSSAAIVFSSDLVQSERASVVLEEITQALGPINDILGNYYTDRSIFSEDGNELTELGQQDKWLLRELYKAP